MDTRPPQLLNNMAESVCDVFAEVWIKVSYDWLTALRSCFMLMSPAFSQPFSLRHKHSIGIRRTKRVRSACAYAYVYVLVSSLAHAHAHAFAYQALILMLMPSAYTHT